MSEFFYVIAGGTMVHVRPHFSLAAPAYGTVGIDLYQSLEQRLASEPERVVVPIATRMAEATAPRNPMAEAQLRGLAEVDPRFVRPETNEDVRALLAHLVADSQTRAIVMAAAVCDWKPIALNADDAEFGKKAPRLKSRAGEIELTLAPADKLIGSIRRERKDIFLVSFKATAGVTREQTYAAGLESLKRSSSNLVLANDVHNRHNVVVTPEEFPYHAETRTEAIETLAEMIVERTRLDFIRTTVDPTDAPADVRALNAAGQLPSNFVPVLEHMIAGAAFKPFLGKTSGHFGCKVEGADFERISSERKVDHNQVFERGMIKIYGYDEAGRIRAGASKPSVGEHTQSQIYERLPAADAIVHFHSPLRPGVDVVPVRSQKPYECGSVQCGLNTAGGMAELAEGIWAVHLEGHGPNIAFSRSAAAQTVIELIDRYWELEAKSGGLLPESSPRSADRSSTYHADRQIDLPI